MEKKKRKNQFSILPHFPFPCLSSASVVTGKTIAICKVGKKRQCRKIQDILSELKFRHHFGIKKEQVASQAMRHAWLVSGERCLYNVFSNEHSQKLVCAIGLR